MMRVLAKMQRTKYESEEQYAEPNNKWFNLKKSGDAMRSKLERLKQEFDINKQRTQWK